MLRRRAWDVADTLGRASTYDAEYVALALLQGDALVTLDPDLARAVDGLVRVAPVDELTGRAPARRRPTRRGASGPGPAHLGRAGRPDATVRPAGCRSRRPARA